MPDSLQAMSARADDHRALLTAAGSPARHRQIVRKDLDGVEDVVQVLNLGDRPQSAKRRADRLADDRAFTNAGVGDAQLAVFRLQAGATLVDVAELSDVFAEDDHRRIAAESVIEAVVDDLESVQHWRIIGICRRHFRDWRSGAVQLLVIPCVVDPLLLAIPLDDVGVAGIGYQRAGENTHGITAKRRLNLLKLLLRIIRAQALQEFDDRPHLGIDRRAILLPRLPLRFADDLQVFALIAIELVRAGDPLRNHPLAHLADAVELRLPIEALFRLVSFLAA